jgi:hypothetical protein
MSAHKNSRLDVSTYNTSPLRKSAPVRAMSSAKPSRTTHFAYETTPVKNFNASASRFGNSGYRTAEKSEFSPSRSTYKSPLKMEVETETVLALRD